ncbi:hypothetical protein Droror1_Dr00004885 [Drosera rotundifolia]
MLIVPTGVSAAIGGFDDDALPVACALASIVDCFISHPNIENVMYVEGYALDRFTEGSWSLQPVHRNKVGLVFDTRIEDDLLLRHLQLVDAAKASLGLPIVEYVVIDDCLEEATFGCGIAPLRLKKRRAWVVALCLIHRSLKQGVSSIPLRR